MAKYKIAKKIRSVSFLFFASLCSMNSSFAFADEEEVQAVKVHGYATQGYSQILSTTANSSLGVLNRNATFLRDSLFGLNISYPLDEKTTFYGQFVASGSNFFTGQAINYTAQADMVMVSYRPFDWMDIRIGRQTSPLWMVSEEIDVGLSYPWIRPPAEVYMLAAAKNLTGVGVDVKREVVDEVILSAGVRYGDSPYDSPDLESAYLKNNFIGYGSIKIANQLSLRGVYGQSHVDTVVKASIFPSFYPTAAAQNMTFAGRYTFSTGRKFNAFGLRLEKENYYILSEYARVLVNYEKVSSEAPYLTALYTSGQEKFNAYYVTTGLRFGDFSPHFTYSEVRKFRSNFTFSDAAKAGAYAIGTAKKLTPMDPVRQRSFALGLNYNLLPTVVLKGQYQYLQAKDNDVKIILGPTLKKGDIVQSISAAVSLVF